VTITIVEIPLIRIKSGALPITNIDTAFVNLYFSLLPIILLYWIKGSFS